MARVAQAQPGLSPRPASLVAQQIANEPKQHHRPAGAPSCLVSGLSISTMQVVLPVTDGHERNSTTAVVVTSRLCQRSFSHGRRGSVSAGHSHQAGPSCPLAYCTGWSLPPSIPQHIPCPHSPCLQESLNLVRNLLSSALSAVVYLVRRYSALTLSRLPLHEALCRNTSADFVSSRKNQRAVFPENHFKDSKMSGIALKALKRDISPEADEVLNWLVR